MLNTVGPYCRAPKLFHVDFAQVDMIGIAVRFGVSLYKG